MIRTRIAPSPTGYLHLGNVRTALFNYLFAKRFDGKFILRIEDTDTERSSKEYEKNIINSFKWCGLQWDEGPDIGGEFGPYRQMERLDIYHKYADELVQNGFAYYNVYSPDNNKEILLKTSNKDEIKDRPFTIAFKIPDEGETSFVDGLHGEISFKNSEIKDVIIMKSSGIPTYNFAVVIDDHLMKISNVIRGEDHIPNTPKQILIYKALGWTPPEFMHVPLILGEDRKPLSKRNGISSVSYFMEEGYLSSALMNYLSSLGWGIDEEIYNFEEKIKVFEPSKISSTPSIFDIKKMDWVNQQHIRLLSGEELLPEFKKWLGIKSIHIDYPDEYILKVLNITKEKITKMSDILAISGFMFEKEISYEEKALKYLKNKEVFSNVLQRIDDIDWTTQSIENMLRDIQANMEIGKKKFFQSVRVAISGKLVTPGLFDVMFVFGKEKVKKLLKSALYYTDTI